MMNATSSKISFFNQYSWPIGVGIGLMIVLLVQGFVLWISLSSSYDLVATDYYQQSVIYDDVTEAKATTRRQKTVLEHHLVQEKERTWLQFQVKNSQGKLFTRLTGNVQAYRPSNSDLDKQATIEQGDREGFYQVQFPLLQKGYWKFTVTFRDQEENLVLYQVIQENL